MRYEGKELMFFFFPDSVYGWCFIISVRMGGCLGFRQCVTLSKCFQQKGTCVYMSLNTVIWPELCIQCIWDFFHITKVIPTHLHAGFLKKWKFVFQAGEWDCCYWKLGKSPPPEGDVSVLDECQVKHGRSQRWDTPSEVRFPGCSKLPIWPSGNARERNKSTAHPKPAWSGHSECCWILPFF